MLLPCKNSKTRKPIDPESHLSFLHSAIIAAEAATLTASGVVKGF